MGLRNHLDTGNSSDCADVDFLNCHQCNRRKAVFAEVSRWAVLVGSLSHTENNCGFRSANVHRVRQLHYAAAFHPQPEYENQQSQTEIPSHKICHYRRVVLLPLLDAKPCHHILECVGQTERCKLGQSVLHSPHICVPADRVSGAHQQLSEPHHLLPHEEGVQGQTEGYDTQRIVFLELGQIFIRARNIWRKNNQDARGAHDIKPHGEETFQKARQATSSLDPARKNMSLSSA